MWKMGWMNMVLNRGKKEYQIAIRIEKKRKEKNNGSSRV